MSKLLDNVVGELSRLPGVGRRTALRLAMHILKSDSEEVRAMTESIDLFRNNICHCAKCGNLSDSEICEICADTNRDHTTLCVVEQVADLLSIEKTHQYRGVYSVLGGVISPMQVRRSETTLFYLMNCLRRFEGLKITTIARGIGFGDELEYVDEHTITQALMNRRTVER